MPKLKAYSKDCHCERNEAIYLFLLPRLHGRKDFAMTPKQMFSV
jgi:hypothetical protein